jgi:hypothetical protein
MTKNGGAKPIIWRHIPTDTKYEFVGDTRSADDTPLALMHAESAEKPIEVDPLDLMKLGGDWEKVD